MALPAFHTLGVISQLLHSAYALSPTLLYPPTALSPTSLPVMPTPDNIIDHMKRTKAEALITIPALLQIWAQDEEVVKYLATLKAIGYSGGSVPTKLGNFMKEQGVTLCSIYGGTEFGAPTYMHQRPSDGDWEYIKIDERVNPVWDAQGDGTFELIFMVNSFFSQGIKLVAHIPRFTVAREPHPLRCQPSRRIRHLRSFQAPSH